MLRCNRQRSREWPTSTSRWDSQTDRCPAAHAGDLFCSFLVSAHSFPIPSKRLPAEGQGRAELEQGPRAFKELDQSGSAHPASHSEWYPTLRPCVLPVHRLCTPYDQTSLGFMGHTDRENIFQTPSCKQVLWSVASNWAESGNSKSKGGCLPQPSLNCLPPQLPGLQIPGW